MKQSCARLRNCKTFSRQHRRSASAALIKKTTTKDTHTSAGYSSALTTRIAKKCERGVILAYLQHTSGYSRAQIKRLVARWHENRLAEVPLAKRYRAPAAPFARKYTASDIDLLVEMDRANVDVCGPAIVHLFKRAYNTYDDKRYERLATATFSGAWMAGCALFMNMNLQLRTQSPDERIIKG